MECGEQFGEYRLVRRLGRGGQGEVYEATCGLNLTWAVKIGHSAFTDDPKALRRVAEEAVWVNEMFHKIPRNCGILAGEHYGVIDQRFYVKMRLLRGESLADRICSKGSLPLQEALTIARSVASAIALAHQHQALHHDIKPANIFLERDGTVQVLDWGCVRLVEAGRIAGATTGGPTCTVGYAALEQYDPSRDAAATAADVYSLGVVLLEMLTGVNPFVQQEQAKPTRTQDSRATVPNMSPDRASAKVTARVSAQGVTVPMAPIAADKPGTGETYTNNATTGQTWSLQELSYALGSEATTSEAASSPFTPPDSKTANSVAAILRYQAVFDVRKSQLVIGLPVPLVDLLSRMLAPDAPLRLSDMTVVVAELEQLVAQREDATWTTWQGPQPRRNVSMKALGAAMVTSMVAAAGYLTFNVQAPNQTLETVVEANVPAQTEGVPTHLVDQAATPEPMTAAALASAQSPLESSNVAPVTPPPASTAEGKDQPALTPKPSKRRTAAARPKVLFEADERQSRSGQNR